MRVRVNLIRKGWCSEELIDSLFIDNLTNEIKWLFSDDKPTTIDLARIEPNDDYYLQVLLYGDTNRKFVITDYKSAKFKIKILSTTQITESGINPNKGQFKNFTSDSLTITSFITKPNGLPHLLDSLALFCDGTLLNLPHEKPNENTIISQWGTQNMTGGAHVLESRFYYRDYLGNDQNSIPHYSETRTVTKKDTINLSK